MKAVAVTDLKNRLSHYLRLVARGESVTITDHGRPVARLSRLEGHGDESAALVAAGIARAPTSPLPRDFLKRKLPKGNARDAIVDDREDRF